MKLVSYFIVLLALIFTSDYIFSYAFERIQNDTFSGQSGGKVNHLLTRFDSVSILAVGDSRSAHHVVPTIISDNGYNLSHNGMSLVFHVGLIDQIIAKDKIVIDTILLHIDVDEAFGKENSTTDDIRFLKQYYHENQWIRSVTDSLYKFDRVKHIFSSYKWNGMVLSTLNNRLKSVKGEIPERGYVEVNSSHRDSINVYWSIRNSNVELIRTSEKLDLTFELLIDHISSRCLEAGIELICISSPAFKTKYSNTNNSDKLISFFDKKKIKYLDFSRSRPLELESVWLWKDNNHLNSDGAAVFSGVLREMLNNL